jgi:hypothetical protein
MQDIAAVPPIKRSGNRNQKYADALNRAAIEDRPAVFHLADLPRCYQQAIRSSARYQGYQVAIRTDREAGTVAVYVIGALSQERVISEF